MDDLADVVDVDAIYMRFERKIVPVKIGLAMIPPLLMRTRELYDLTEPPLGRDDCKDCRLLESLLSIMAPTEARMEK
jgi:hypothetical protein